MLSSSLLSSGTLPWFLLQGPATLILQFLRLSGCLFQLDQVFLGQLPDTPGCGGQLGLDQRRSRLLLLLLLPLIGFDTSYSIGGGTLIHGACSRARGLLEGAPAQIRGRNAALVEQVPRARADRRVVVRRVCDFGRIGFIAFHFVDGFVLQRLSQHSLQLLVLLRQTLQRWKGLEV